MKITFVGKYPPIVGGESTKLYWLAKKLGEKGHECSIVSDCQEREDKAILNLEDLNYLQPKNVNLYSTSLVSLEMNERQFKTERLADLSIKAVGKKDSDLIIGWYLLPYGSAASIASQYTGKDYILQHAGSDMKNFFGSQNLKSFLLNQFASARSIMSYPSYFNAFSKGKENVFFHNPKIDQKGFEECPEFNRPDYLQNRKLITFLGKISESKGALDLLNAYCLMGESKEYTLVYIGEGKIKKDLQKIVNERNLQNVFFLSPVPTWRVPGILRLSDVFFLGERGFYVKNHFSRKGIEAMLCRSPLIISYEMKNKGAYTKLIDGENCIGVDPRDTKQLSGKLKQLLGDESFSENVRRRGYEFACQSNKDFDSYVDNVENYLKEISSNNK